MPTPITCPVVPIAIVNFLAKKHFVRSASTPGMSRLLIRGVGGNAGDCGIGPNGRLACFLFLCSPSSFCAQTLFSGFDSFVTIVPRLWIVRWRGWCWHFSQRWLKAPEGNLRGIRKDKKGAGRVTGAVRTSREMRSSERYKTCWS